MQRIRTLSRQMGMQLPSFPLPQATGEEGQQGGAGSLPAAVRAEAGAGVPAGAEAPLQAAPEEPQALLEGERKPLALLQLVHQQLQCLLLALPLQELLSASHPAPGEALRVLLLCITRWLPQQELPFLRAVSRF